jgi:hypothetical protein
MKGIGRQVVPYDVEGLLDGFRLKTEIFSEHMVGADFYLDPARVAADTSVRLRHVLQRALNALDKHRDETPDSRRDAMLSGRAGYARQIFASGGNPATLTR